MEKANKDNFFAEIKGKVLEKEDLATHTTFRIGGLADYFIYPQDSEDLKNIIRICKNEDLPFFVLGKGSNILFSDSGYRGVVIDIMRKFKNIGIDKNEITAQAGATLSAISKFAYQNSLSGLEALGSIPGTVGGAIVMNAGAYDSNISDNLRFIEVLNYNGDFEMIATKKVKFSYRESSLKDLIILSAKFNLKMEDKEVINMKRRRFLDRKKAAQPLSLLSAGSVFKNPQEMPAWELIEKCNLKGFSIGDAEISKKHANFIVNAGYATAKDVKDLIEYVQTKVFEEFKISLETEIMMVGFDK